MPLGNWEYYLKLGSNSLICPPNNKYGGMQLIALNFKQYRERCMLGIFPLVLLPRPLFAFRILHFSLNWV